MNKTLRNFWLDLSLFLLLGTDIALISLSRRAPAGIHPGFGWHVHVLISILLTLACLIHIILHWRWFQAVLTGKARGKTKLIMISIVTIVMLLADLSGHGAVVSSGASGLHSLTGYTALVGLSVHAIRRAHWMAMVAKRLLMGGPQKEVVRPALTNGSAPGRIKGLS